MTLMPVAPGKLGTRFGKLPQIVGIVSGQIQQRGQ